MAQAVIVIKAGDKADKTFIWSSPSSLANRVKPSHSVWENLSPARRECA